MLHMIFMIFSAILIIGVGLWLMISAFLIAGYFIFCSPYLWWSNAHLPKDKRKFSMVRDYRNAFRFYKSKVTGQPPVFL